MDGREGVRYFHASITVIGSEILAVNLHLQADRLKSDRAPADAGEAGAAARGGARTAVGEQDELPAGELALLLGSGRGNPWGDCAAADGVRR
jgi:hypothetical protein